MKFIIHFEHADGSEDSLLIEGETIEDVRAKAASEVAKRNGSNPWSEQLQ